MTEYQVLKDILNLIEHELNVAVDRDAFTIETPLSYVWLQLESINVVELIILIETKFGVTIPDEFLGNVDRNNSTVGSLIKKITMGQSH